MFSGRKKEEIVEDIDSLIGENIKIIGKIEGKGNIRIDGTVEGDIDYDGNIVIGEAGNINGNIKASNISLAGMVKGNIVSNTKLVLLSTGKLIGDLEVPSFIVHENARFDGNCKMTNNKAVEVDSKNIPTDKKNTNKDSKKDSHR